MLADDSLDAIEILTPHHLHAEQAIAAFEAGKHVSIQKPPTITLDEFDRVVDAAGRAGKIFKTFENFHFYPPHQLARSLIDNGEIGEVLSVRIVTASGNMGNGQGWEIPADSYTWRLDPAKCGGGTLTFDHGYHSFEMGRFFVDAPIDRVHSFVNFFEIGPGMAFDIPALISWSYSGQPVRMGSWELIASLGLDIEAEYYVTDDRIEIRGSQGIVWVNKCSGEVMKEPPVVLYRGGESRGFHRVDSRWATSFRLATHDFINAIREGRPASSLAPPEARATLAFALAAQVSARENREVSIAELG